MALTRDMANPLVYDAAAVQDPLVRELARRIELVPLDGGPGAPHNAGHETPGFWPAEVTIECGAERHTFRTRPHKGAPSNPFTWDDACEKFRRYTSSMLHAGRAAAIIELVERLEAVSDVADVAALIASK